MREIEDQYTKVQDQYTSAAKRIEQVQQMQDKQRKMAQQAELTAGLLEKVPRSFILAELTNGIPEGVSLLDFRLDSIVQSGPPPKPKSSGLFDVFGGDDVVNQTPVQSYEITSGGFVITLPDGQVWQQTDDDAAKNPVRWRQPASSMRVTIRQGAMRSFNLVLNDENLHHKVRRIR